MTVFGAIYPVLRSVFFAQSLNAGFILTLSRLLHGLDRFGVQYTPAGVVDLLNRIGFTYKKTKEVPCEGNIEKQQSFAGDMSEIFKNQDENAVIGCS